MIFEYIRLTGTGGRRFCFVFPLKYLESHDYRIVKSYITILLSLRNRRWGECLRDGELQYLGVDPVIFALAEISTFEPVLSKVTGRDTSFRGCWRLFSRRRNDRRSTE